MVPDFRHIRTPAILPVKFQLAIFSVFLIGLALISYHDYILFHTLAEMYTIVVSGCIFIIFWNSRHFLDNHYFLFIGISYLFVGIVDTFHTLSYRGIYIFQVENDASLCVQLWVAARYLESLALMAAPLFIKRKLKTPWVFILFSLVTSFLLASIFYWKNFPQCFIEGRGLTPFKIYSEYLISLALALAAMTVYRQRACFDKVVYRLLLASIILTIGSELSFTLYDSVYGFFNMTGHLLKIISFYLMYKAMVEICIDRPHKMMFGKLVRSEEHLEKVVRERTSELEAANRKLQQEIAERGQAEIQIRKNQDFLANILNALSHPFYVINAEDYNIVLANEVSGYGNRMDNSKCYALTHGKSEPCGGECVCPLQEVKNAGEPMVVEHVHYDADCNPRNVEIHAYPVLDDTGKVVQVIEYALDITKRKRAETELHKWAHIFENAAWGVATISPDGKSFEIMNPAFARMHGYTIDELKEKPIIDLFAPKSRLDIPRQMALSHENGYHSFECMHLRKDGSLFPVLCHITVVKDDNGRVLYQAVNAQDVSARRKTEEEKEQLEKQLLQSQKMRAIGTLAGGIAHDFNNILFGITGYAELALEQLHRGSDLKEALYQILSAGNRAKELIRQILTFSRQTDVKKQPVEIVPILKESLKFIRASLPANINIHSKIDINRGTVLADPTQLNQVFVNLYTNAGQAMERTGGALEVGLEEIEAGSDFAKVYELNPGKYFKLSVQDSGHGISPEIRDRIFEPFYTTKPQGEGTGIGLSVVHGIVKACRGAITVSSNRGKGSLFEVYFPKIEETPIQNHEESEPVSGGREHILLVEDEGSLIRMIQEMLEQRGYEVTSFMNSAEALEVFRQHPERYELVVMDQTMPVMTGAELAKEMLKIAPRIPLILMTGYSKLITAEMAAEIGFRRFLLKPFKHNELGTAIREVLDE